MSKLSRFSQAWNTIYKNHQSSYYEKSVPIVEENDNAPNKTFTLNCSEVVSFPSKQLNSYDLFGALSKCNCDGCLLVSNGDGTYDFIYVEMKSRFSSTTVIQAKRQIIETRIKMKSLLQMVKCYTELPIKAIYGIIETLKLDEEQELWWLKQQLLQDKDLDFGMRLLKYSSIKASMECNSELDIPSEMVFKMILCDGNDVIDYSEIIE